MLAEAYIENDRMVIVNFPKDQFKGHHWKVNIAPVEEIKDKKTIINSIDLFFDKFQIDFSSYKFNRDEANER